MLNFENKFDKYVETHMEEIWEISKYIHSNPELGFQEHKASKVQCDFLEKYGFDVQRGVGSLDTAFIAKYGEGTPVVAIASEYDALKKLGHACGHNLISSSSILTGITVKKYLEESNDKGTVIVIGTPAEEGGGGKIKLLDYGAFNYVDCVFMMHPTSGVSRLAGKCLSSYNLHIKFKGKSAHAGSHPDKGRNALSAANLYFNAIGFWRQHLNYDMRVSNIITSGGEQTGMIPELVEVECNVRGFTLKDVKTILSYVKKAAKGSAVAMDCEIDIEEEQGYLGRIPNETLSNLCKKELNRIGEEVMDGLPSDFGGEDLGNVSYKIPICNPYITIFKDYKISGHTDKFRELAISDSGYRCIEVAAKVMSNSIIRIYNEPKIVDDAKGELKNKLDQYM